MELSQIINNAVSALNSKDTKTANKYLKQIIQNQDFTLNILFEFINAYKKLGFFSQILVIVDYALSLNIKQLDLCYEKSMLHCMLGEQTAAIDNLEWYLAQNKSWSKGYLGLGTVYSYYANYTKALESFDFALKLAPNFTNAKVAKATILLKLGKFQQGFKLYDARNQYLDKLYKGEDLTDKTLLIRQEQGIGDIINFIPYINKLKKNNTKFIVEVDARMIELLSRSFSNTYVKFIANIQAIKNNEFDYQLPIASLLKFCLNSVHDICNFGAYIKACETLSNRLRHKYKSIFNNKPIVGISWHTNSLFTKEQRNTKLEHWQQILQDQSFGFVSLQYGDVKSKISTFNNTHKTNLYFDDSIDSMQDLDTWTAQLAAVDIVITIDNCTAHFAASLGKQVIVLLPLHSDWRYFTKNNNSPWYSNMQLIRQQELYNWEEVFIELGAALCNNMNIVQKSYKVSTYDN